MYGRFLEAEIKEVDVALSKEKKVKVVEQATDMLANSKLVVVANYRGTSVQSLQKLRRQARDQESKVRIIKNRLVKKAMQADERFKNANLEFLTGQLMYAFSDSDEVVPARVIADFAKSEPQVEFVAGINADGIIINAQDVEILAALPTRDQLRGQLVGLVAAPLSGMANVLSANARGLLNVLSARTQQI
ncbi:50S ribosomal protein L10 [Candidatus Saccharibacteria bacterium RIFCSPHIGHO2_12_FULL_49_19]|nr:MAG: 50S ribosomal protein L10 [Candidatus Saccharibacteria bacterium RIFCSPHIGHO2_01_FULL_49_21]OGL37010.1 MAG: 50S ribosomal protein L10 [Candidatus Saccharibacteria bacterium RIFCSPHIGHO2_12_FULL_49_19]OGL38551.1 MAG: 50S ribosomal protein L10 [Candidatus Saccharibacteria bacterium RIFCSPLOWO2_01_FULL_49_22]